MHQHRKLQQWIDERIARIDFSRFAFDRAWLAQISDSPGVYLMRNRSGEVIYIGKSDCLRRRVRSYFTPRALEDPKVARIHAQLSTIETLPCPTEVEALMLELRMIRDFRPPINLQAQVHEQPSRYGQGRNLLLLVPAAGRCEIYFIKNGRFVAHLAAPLGSAPSRKLQARIRSTFFGKRNRTKICHEEWEAEIVQRWFSANKKRLNFIDVDEAGGCEPVFQRLTCYLNDPDRLLNKVYYR